MERRFSRRADLVLFRCDLASLEALALEVREHMGDDEIVESYSIALPGEELRAASLAEFDEARLPDNVKAFSVSFTRVARGGTSRSFGLWIDPLGARCSADGDSQGWCAGAVELGTSFA